jgi:hypothetical protein
MSRRAYYSAPVAVFLGESTDSVIGKIAQNHPQELKHLQTGAWARQIEILRGALEQFRNAHVLFEVLIPRMGRRADVVLIYRHLIFVLEFKVGATEYFSQDLRQAHGYALDLSYFHEGSHNKSIVPILVATDAPFIAAQCRASWDAVLDPIKTNATGIGAVIADCTQSIAEAPDIDVAEWLQARYKPTPTIIEAAQALYASHDVHDIGRNDAGAQNLHLTSKRIQEIVHASRLAKRKAICFVTGVPGAGKTLVGLNIATANTNAEDDEHAVFLSGNGPLVEVLREALTRDQVARNPGRTKSAAAKTVEKMIQNIHHFRDEYLGHSKAPPDQVVIFDEAQRAWDQPTCSKFMRQKRNQPDFNQSEPEFLVGVMDRHTDWCVIVALIGGGQEINTGEAGLSGWVSALAGNFPHWDIYFSEKLDQPEYAGREVDCRVLLNAHSDQCLHLATSMRSFKAEKLSHMVHHIVHNDPQKAVEFYAQLGDKFPIKITRDLQLAKNWIRTQARGTETVGLIASSGALRLKPEGIFVKNSVIASDWFLNGPGDVRSCHYLEDVATEFDIQGLELDWCLIGWDADYRYIDGKFEHWKFTGNAWRRRHQSDQQRHLENAYRVLLTRARQGMVIFVPMGEQADKTRKLEFYDATFHYLMECGAEHLAAREKGKT